MKTEGRPNVRRLTNILFGIAGACFVVGLVILILTFGPLATEEVKYAVRPSRPAEIVPIDKEFGVVIPKLAANAHVVANVDPYDSKAYQYALTKGVAHARGTAVPGAIGDVFLFAHSSENFYEALKYNSVFYLLPKLVAGDPIILYYHGAKFTYLVTDKRLVDPKDVSYLTSKGDSQTLTLMTCWPPGTNIKRLLVFATLKK